MTQAKSEEPRRTDDWIALSEVREGAMTVHKLSTGRKAVLFREGSLVRAFSEICPHMGADLAEATFCTKSGHLTCKWHGYVFSASDGTFVDNPNERLTPLLRKPSEHFRPEKTPAYRLRALPTRVEGDRVYVGRQLAPEGSA